MSVNVAPVIISAKDINMHYGEQILLDNANLTIHQGDRIGLVGRNGTGKSTFLKIIAGQIEPDSGEIAKRKDLKLSYLPQDITLDPAKTVYENILEGASELIAIVREYEAMPLGSEKRHVLEERITAIDGWNIENQIKILMSSLNAPDPERDVVTLSGGERRRIAICRALISRPDFLILDEPTNHLDTESIEWTEEFLAGYSGTCLFVTHDRYFLDRIANRIVELSGGVLYSHSGNYTDYLINKSERIQQQEAEERKRLSFLRRELEWVKRGPKARRTKAKARLDNYNEVAQQKGLEQEMDVELIIPPPVRPGRKILDLKNVGVELGGRKLFEYININFEPGRKLGVVGRNGLGKTTLLKVILGEMRPTDGIIEIGEKTFFNYVDQGRLLLNEENTVLDEIGEGREFINFGNEKITVWKYLRRFLFTDDRINTRVGRLSGGEKSRLLLARILKNGGNFLILDEPTNDLDLPTLRILEEALITFDGVVIVVSHDRYFLNRVCNQILSFEGDGKTYLSEGDYDYYLEKRNARRKEEKQKSEKPAREDTRVKAAVRKLTWKEARELEAIEERILEAEQEASDIENIFSSPDFFEKHARRTNELNQQLEEIKLKIAQLYDRWEELEKIKKGEIQQL